MSAAARCFFGKKRKNADKWAKKSAESLSLSAEIPLCNCYAALSQSRKLNFSEASLLVKVKSPLSLLLK